MSQGDHPLVVMRVMRSLAAMLLAVASVAGTQSPVESDLEPTAVRVLVTAEDPILAQVTECLNADLEQTPSVTVSEDASALTLDVIVAEQTLTDGTLTGYLVYAGGYLPGPTQPGDESATTSERPVIIQWQSLRIARPNLDAVCTGITEGFLIEVIEPVRKELERIRNLSPLRTAP